MWYNGPSAQIAGYSLGMEPMSQQRAGAQVSGRQRTEPDWEWGVTSDRIWDGRSEDSQLWLFPYRFCGVEIVYIWGGPWARLTAPANMHSTSPVHPNSLVDPATHSPALLELTTIKLSRPVIRMFFLFAPCHYSLLLFQNILSTQSSRQLISQWDALLPLHPAHAARNMQSSLHLSKMSSSARKSLSKLSLLPSSISTGLSLISILPSKNGPWNESSSVPSS